MPNISGTARVQELLDAMLHEIEVCQHLYRQLPAGSLSYRPTEGQRSLEELLRYLTISAEVGVAVALAQDPEVARPIYERAETQPADGFPKAMEQQAAYLRETLGMLSDVDLDRESWTPPYGKTSLNTALLRTGYGFLCAYRMQLFLYAKAAGAAHLNTVDAWVGISRDEWAAKREANG